MCMIVLHVTINILYIQILPPYRPIVQVIFIIIFNYYLYNTDNIPVEQAIDRKVLRLSQ